MLSSSKRSYLDTLFLNNLIMINSRFLFKNVNIKIQKIIMLPVVSYGCQTWSLILREEQRMKVFENRVLSRIFEPKRYKIIRGWHTEELHCLYSSPNTIRTVKSPRIRWARHIARMREIIVS
jgi:hypothetical protein